MWHVTAASDELACPKLPRRLSLQEHRRQCLLELQPHPPVLLDPSARCKLPPPPTQEKQICSRFTSLKSKAHFPAVFLPQHPKSSITLKNMLRWSFRRMDQLQAAAPPKSSKHARFKARIPPSSRIYQPQLEPSPPRIKQKTAAAQCIRCAPPPHIQAEEENNDRWPHPPSRPPPVIPARIRGHPWKKHLALAPDLPSGATVNPLHQLPIRPAAMPAAVAAFPTVTPYNADTVQSGVDFTPVLAANELFLFCENTRRRRRQMPPPRFTMSLPAVEYPNCIVKKFQRASAASARLMAPTMLGQPSLMITFIPKKELANAAAPGGGGPLRYPLLNGLGYLRGPLRHDGGAPSGQWDHPSFDPLEHDRGNGQRRCQRTYIYGGKTTVRLDWEGKRANLLLAATDRPNHASRALPTPMRIWEICQLNRLTEHERNLKKKTLWEKVGFSPNSFGQEKKSQTFPPRFSAPEKVAPRCARTQRLATRTLARTQSTRSERSECTPRPRSVSSRAAGSLKRGARVCPPTNELGGLSSRWLRLRSEAKCFILAPRPRVDALCDGEGGGENAGECANCTPLVWEARVGEGTVLVLELVFFEFEVEVEEFEVVAEGMLRREESSTRRETYGQLRIYAAVVRRSTVAGAVDADGSGVGRASSPVLPRLRMSCIRIGVGISFGIGRGRGEIALRRRRQATPGGGLRSRAWWRGCGLRMNGVEGKEHKEGIRTEIPRYGRQKKRRCAGSRKGAWRRGHGDQRLCSWWRAWDMVIHQLGEERTIRRKKEKNLTQKHPARRDEETPREQDVVLLTRAILPPPSRQVVGAPHFDLDEVEKLVPRHAIRPVVLERVAENTAVHVNEATAAFIPKKRIAEAKERAHLKGRVADGTTGNPSPRGRQERGGRRTFCAEQSCSHLEPGRGRKRDQSKVQITAGCHKTGACLHFALAHYTSASMAFPIAKEKKELSPSSNGKTECTAAAPSSRAMFPQSIGIVALFGKNLAYSVGRATGSGRAASLTSRHVRAPCLVVPDAGAWGHHGGVRSGTSGARSCEPRWTGNGGLARVACCFEIMRMA
ncbi:hypothetical protein B0H19DRAFT_1084407 [Mycena capillaripes]|nr:hypothetical protein B0H19DRAFT_1084407 [Mycena capillaripes]